jgi:hypothetical protein
MFLTVIRGTLLCNYLVALTNIVSFVLTSASFLSMLQRLSHASSAICIYTKLDASIHLLAFNVYRQ